MFRRHGHEEVEMSRVVDQQNSENAPLALGQAERITVYPSPHRPDGRREEQEEEYQLKNPQLGEHGLRINAGKGNSMRPKARTHAGDRRRAQRQEDRFSHLI